MSATPTTPVQPAKAARQATVKPDDQTLTQPPAPPKPAAAAVPDTAATAGEEEEEAYEEPSSLASHFVLFNALPSSLVSGVVHFVGFLALALLSIDPPQKTETLAISAAPAERDESDQLKEEQLNLNLDALVSSESAQAAEQVLQDVVATTDTLSVAMDVDAAPVQIELSDFGEQTAPKSDLMATIGSFTGSGLSGRGAAERGRMVASVGGTSESEAAVAMALKWFADHQNQDGSWSFDHRSGPCQGRCPDAGSLANCRAGATAMALLPFLGAGQTHQQGQYKHNVERGLYFLANHMRVRNEGGLQGGDLSEVGGSMYSHGLAAITLCEAYAMTKDRKLMGPAQLSLNHIMYAQDPIGGGWRYRERTPGDTSVVGWQLMALKSGHMAYLSVAPSTIQGAMKFLDTVQADSGAKYGYTGPGQGPATTAVGLLCRMYLGWKHDHPALKRGVENLSRAGPSVTAAPDFYYNYYATQVMRQYCGEPGADGHAMWEKWNAKMRDWLVEKQEKKGHAKGSWYVSGRHSDKGGRLYCTSMGTMILEVYYRHMPIYGTKAASDEFPL
jgi:hypothetical protein